MDAAIVDLESQAAQLLVQLHATSNPAFADGDGMHDEEFLLRADPLGAAARASERNRTDGKRAGGGATTGSSSSAGGGYLSHPHDNHDDITPSLEVEHFRAQLKQQRVPSLRLLVGVADVSVPALICVLSNAIPVGAKRDTLYSELDTFCRGGRFDSLYYDAKFKGARVAEKQKQQQKHQEELDKKECLFRPRSKEDLGAELVARKRGAQWPPPEKQATAEGKPGDPTDTTAANLEKKKDKAEGEEGGGGKAKTSAEQDLEETMMQKPPDAFFQYAMQWKKHRCKKLDKKVDKLKKEQAEEDQETFKPWHMTEESRAMARQRELKIAEGSYAKKVNAPEFSFRPQTTPYKPKRSVLADDVLERMQIDLTKRSEDQMMRHVAAETQFRVKSPVMMSRQQEKDFSEHMFRNTPRRASDHNFTPPPLPGTEQEGGGASTRTNKKQTYRKPVFNDAPPTFSPVIGAPPERVVCSPPKIVKTTHAAELRAAKTRRAVSTPASGRKKNAAGDHDDDFDRFLESSGSSDDDDDDSEEDFFAPSSTSKKKKTKKKKNRHDQCIADATKPLFTNDLIMTDGVAAARFRRDAEAMVEREKRLEEIRDQIQAKRDAECTFHTDVLDSPRTDRLSSRYYEGLEDGMLQQLGASNDNTPKSSRTRTARILSPAESSPARQVRKRWSGRIQQK